MKFSILTLFPEALQPYFDSSILGRAKKDGKLDIELIQIRDFSADRHKKVDDAPFGGGAGMVMAVQPLRDALFYACRSHFGGVDDRAAEATGERDEKPTDSDAIPTAVRQSSHRAEPRRRILLTSPRGSLLTHSKCEELATYDHLIIVCGHYEGIDQRFIDRYVEEEVSIGDYVLTGGELAAAVLVDSVSRLREHVLRRDSLDFESHSAGLLEYPHYTRPEEIDGDRVPDILLSGHHKRIDEWRLNQAIEITRKRRPDLYRAYRKNSAQE